MDTHTTHPATFPYSPPAWHLTHTTNTGDWASFKIQICDFLKRVHLNTNLRGEKAEIWFLNDRQTLNTGSLLLIGTTRRQFLHHRHYFVCLWLCLWVRVPAVTFSLKLNDANTITNAPGVGDEALGCSHTLAVVEHFGHCRVVSPLVVFCRAPLCRVVSCRILIISPLSLFWRCTRISHFSAMALDGLENVLLRFITSPADAGVVELVAGSILIVQQIHFTH